VSIHAVIQNNRRFCQDRLGTTNRRKVERTTFSPVVEVQEIVKYAIKHPARKKHNRAVEERSFPTEKRQFAETRSGQPYGKAAICQDTLGTTVWKPQTRALAGVRRTHQRILSAPNF
jgi:hypothetical protein